MISLIRDLHTVSWTQGSRQQAAYFCAADAAGRDYVKLVEELRALQTALKRLEDAIAAVQCGPTGVTRPGAFLFELLGGVQINQDTVFDALSVADAAVELLSDDTMGQMRRCNSRSAAIQVCVQHATQRRNKRADIFCAWLNCSILASTSQAPMNGNF
jgi:hypothetical protein